LRVAFAPGVGVAVTGLRFFPTLGMLLFELAGVPVVVLLTGVFVAGVFVVFLPAGVALAGVDVVFLLAVVFVTGTFMVFLLAGVFVLRFLAAGVLTASDALLSGGPLFFPTTGFVGVDSVACTFFPLPASSFLRFPRDGSGLLGGKSGAGRPGGRPLPRIDGRRMLLTMMPFFARSTAISSVRLSDASSSDDKMSDSPRTGSDPSSVSISAENK